jgi:hypothetical protein
MRKARVVFFAALIPVFLLAAAGTTAGALLFTTFCLEQSPIGLRGILAIPFFASIVIYFFMDRALTRQRFIAVLARTFAMFLAVGSQSPFQAWRMRRNAPSKKRRCAEYARS